MNKNIILVVFCSLYLIAFDENEKEYIESVPGTKEKVEMVVHGDTEASRKSEVSWDAIDSNDDMDFS